MIADLEALLICVKKATEPSEDIDFEFSRIFEPESIGTKCVEGFGQTTTVIFENRNFTDSIDAATGLIERVMGERFGWCVDRWGNAHAGDYRIHNCELTCETPAFGLLAAFLTAFIDIRKKNEHH